MQTLAMIGRDDVIGRLGALIERHSPRRVLVIVRHAVSARWLASLLAERGVTVGARIVGLEGLLRGAAVELAGVPVPPMQMLALVRQAVVGDPYVRCAAIAVQRNDARQAPRRFVE